jgi:hypothetical protein
MAMKKLKSFYKWYLSGWVLLITALLLFNLILVPGIIAQLLAVLVTIYIYRKPVVFEEEQGWLDIGTKVKEIRDPFQWLNHIALHLAIALDKLCNVLFSYLLDVVFTKEYIVPEDWTGKDRPWNMTPYRFGNHRDTISEVIGRNKQLGTLTRAGRALDWILDWIDPGHSEEAIE